MDNGVVVNFVRQEILHTFGRPEFIQSDSRTYFSESHINNFSSKEGFEWMLVAAYNPRGNVREGRMVGKIKTALKKVIAKNHLDWDKMFPSILREYR